MKVAIISPDPRSQAGGVERFCYSLRDAVAAVMGWDMRLAGADERLETWGPDVVITNGTLRSAIRGCRRVHIYHGCWAEHMRYDHRSASTRWRVKTTVEGAYREMVAGLGAVRVAVSRSAAHEVRHWYGLSSTVIPNAVDVSLFAPRDRDEVRRSLGVSSSARLALFPGRPEERKRPDLALAAAKAAGFTLLHAGSSALRGATELGALNPPELAQWYAAVDVVISSSDYEASSLAVLEALAVGTPVVGTRVGWLRDLEQAIPQYGRLLSDRGDVVQLTEALRRSSTNLDMVARASVLVRTEHSLRALGAQYAALLERVAG